MQDHGDFQKFIHPDCNRRQFILDMLKDFGVPAVPLSLEGAHHILVKFPPSAYNPQYKMKTVLAHYDRVDTSPGANDNSAAVFQIIYWARRLLRFPGFHNVQIIFSDGEEMGGSEGVAEQGAFGIATKFRSLGLTQQDVYAFDCCGRGDFVILSQAGMGKGSIPFQRQFNSLVERTEDLIKSVAGRKWAPLPVPYSDNAGFLACGIPAVAITLLPAQEVVSYLRELKQHPGLQAAIMKSTQEQEVGARKIKPLEPYQVQEKMPMTWRLLHTEYDNLASLTPESFPLMEALLDALAKSRTPI
ncbi:MAG: M28 family peptidase [Treponema sp.]|nr:M28 family peptidase [Treponema sp.]